MTIFLYIAELIGIAVFAASGAMAGIRSRLDVFGVTVLGVVTATGGGLIRDVILGLLPPRVFYNYRYILIALLVSAGVFLVFYFKRAGFKRESAILEGLLCVLDALGLGIFAVTGAGYTIEAGYGDNGFMVVFLGMLTGVGGGMLRDLLAGSVPVVLRKQIYATAAILGSGLYYLLLRLHAAQAMAMGLGVFATVLLRIAAAHFKWNFPRIREASGGTGVFTDSGH